MTTSSNNNPTGFTDSNTLEDARQLYQYNYTYIPPVAMLDIFPDIEQFSRDWLYLLAQNLRIIFVNTIITNRGNRGSASVRDDVRDFILEALVKGAIPAQASVITHLLQIIPQMLLTGLSRDFRELDDLFFSLLKESGLSVLKDSLARIKALMYEGQPTGHINSLKDYEKLFPQMELPALVNTFQQDDVFAYMQVAGYNPLMIQRVTSPGENFPVTNEHYQAVMGNDDSLQAAGEEGRLYLIDYKILDGAVNGTYPHEQKYLYAPLALFAVPKGTETNRMLRAIAIQCGQNHTQHPIITPNSGKYSWLFAKTVVHIADANFHEAVSHLARTHLFVGAFIIATYRQLPAHHPLSVLLRPHFAGTLAINEEAQRQLIAPLGGVDRLLSSSIDNSRVFAVHGLQSYGFNTAMLPKQLHLRGVDDTNLLPVYPYRDDALLIWNAIHQWVSDYLNLYYKTNVDIQQDTHLQAWGMEAQAFDGGRIPDFGEENGRIQTREYLTDAITLIIFTASAQHAVVNFPQKDLMSYAGMIPMAGYAPASTLLKPEVTEQDYLKLFPPLEQAQRQLNLLYLLGSTYYTKLGDYQQGHFTDTKVQPLLQKFQNRLQEVEQTINQRNCDRPPYTYLLPSKIPQSINI
ncbi:MAG: lipoxygenase family protein [Scytonema sp. PMC 1069.18]|nr:lipoxygenase family protein [Scytonema sp. PMC 1069.18]MEC4885458.1 lipoxygenase family protein [Scytonema sp. PMC 1070.18]